VHTRRALPYVFGFFAVAGFPVAVSWMAPTAPPELVPSVPLSLAWVGPFLLLARLQNPFNKLAGVIWVAWYWIGSINVVASYYVYGGVFQMSVERAGFIYLLSTTAFLLGLLTAEIPRRHDALGGSKESTATPTILNDRFPLPLLILLCAFPILFAWSMYRALGYFPILQGTDITEEIYELDYGRLYGYAVLLVFSMVLVVDRLIQARSGVQRGLFGFALVAFAFICILDGKRHTLMLSLVAAAAYLFGSMRARSRRIRPTAVAAFLALGAVLYVVVFVVRQGFQVEQYQLAAFQFSSIGDEYRDFAYSVNEYAPGQIPEYRWFTSALAAGLNSALLAGLGVDKHQEAIHGSAYVWQTLFGSNYGVRTGIVSELYFAYGWVSLPVILAFGMLSGWLGRKLDEVRTRTGLTFVAIVYGILLLSVVGQTTSMTGALSIVLYVYLLSLIVRGLPRHPTDSHTMATAC
jgi:hypothetical protein